MKIIASLYSSTKRSIYKHMKLSHNYNIKKIIFLSIKKDVACKLKVDVFISEYQMSHFSGCTEGEVFSKQKIRIEVLISSSVGHMATVRIHLRLSKAGAASGFIPVTSQTPSCNCQRQNYFTHKISEPEIKCVLLPGSGCL